MKNLVYQGGLSVVNVGNDGDVTYLHEGCFLRRAKVVQFLPIMG
jgi:hypothetical protein